MVVDCQGSELYTESLTHQIEMGMTLAESYSQAPSDTSTIVTGTSYAQQMRVCAPCTGSTHGVDSEPTDSSDWSDVAKNPRFCQCASGYGFGYAGNRQLSDPSDV